MLRYGLNLRLLGTLAAICLFLTGLLQPLCNTITDARFRLAARSPSGEVVLVTIDADSLARVKQPWPWSRSLHRSIVDVLRSAGVAEIAFDVDFSSAADASGDAAFAAALQRAKGRVLLAALKQRVGSDESGSWVTNQPLKQFADAAEKASVNVTPDADLLTRSFSRSESFGGQDVKSLPVLLSGQKGDLPPSFLIDYGINGTRIKRIPVADLLLENFDPADLRGKKVIVGATALELRDYFQVPRFGYIPGVLLQALAAESLIQGRALEPVAPAIPVLICVLLMLGAWVLRRTDMSVFIVVCALTALAIEGGAIGLQRGVPLMLDTSVIHIELLILAVVAVLVEIDIRRVKILVSRANANRLRAILDRVISDNFAGVVVVDEDGTVRAISRAAAGMFGVEETAVDLHADRFLPPVLLDALAETRARVHAGAWAATAPQAARVLPRPGEKPVDLEYVTTVSHVPGVVLDNGRSLPDQMAICITFQDVTERRRAEADIVRLAHFDSLTGLANRHSFLARVDAALTRRSVDKPCLAVLLFDLDRFKLVNDRLGHSCGDALLKLVADRIRTIVQNDDDVVARLGGDEFALVVERETTEATTLLAHQLVERLCDTYEIEAYQVSVAISLGMAVAEFGTAATLLKRADAALYAAKAAGGARVRLYDTAMEEQAEAGRILEQDLREAIRREELEVFYQRQVDTSTETIIGVEALARWKHPRRGYISPTEFIPVAERTGLVEEIGAWVLMTACREAVAWPIPIRLSVNLSPVQLSRGDLVRTVARALADSGLSPDRLDLELTESLLMENAGFARGTLDRIRELGVGLALDDFGTGYSSLAYLKSFDIDKIKIDRSFVKDLPDDHSSIAIIRAVVTLAQTLGLRVNSEGVETVEQLTLLRELGCDEVQGFLHGRPEPSAAIQASLLEALARSPADRPLRLAS